MRYPVEELSAQIVETYYHNDLSLFWEYMDDEIIWIGPAKSQYMIGKQNLMAAWAKEKHALTFSTSHFSSMIMPGSGRTTCEVLVQFYIYTHYKDNYIVKHHQRITFFWKKVKVQEGREWRYAVMHISNGHDYDSRDTIYPMHYDEFTQNRQHAETPLMQKMHSFTSNMILRAEDYSTYYIDPQEIRYVKAEDKVCEVHTTTETLRVRYILNELEPLLPNYFYRIHRSYIVNVNEIYHLSKSILTLRDQTKLPVPYKRYTQIVEELAALMKQLQITNGLAQKKDN